MTPRVRRVPAAGLAAVALLGSLALAGCGDDKAEPQAAKAPCGLKDTRKGHLSLQTAPEAFAKATSKRMTVRFRQELTLGKRSAAIEGSVDSGPDKLYALEQTMPGDDGTIKLIVVDEKVYVSAEGEDDGKYYRIDPDDAADPLAAPMKAWFDRAGASKTATAWSAGLLAVRYVGKETLDDGSKTELYEFDVDPRLAARAAGTTVSGDVPRIATSYVWVDDYDLIRQVRTHVGDEKTLETWTGFCEPLDIEAPDPSDIIER